MTSERYYEFQPPTNMKAIRSSIMQRIKQRTEKSNASSVASSPSPLTPPPTSNREEFDNKKSTFLLHLDNGLPSPPIETCLYEEEESTLPTEVVVNALLELNEELDNNTKPAAVVTLATSEELRERIKLLKEEKHRLFQVMKDLLSKPASSTSMETTTAATTTTATTTEVVPMVTPVKERARSSSRELKTRPVIRSRSISHNEYKPPSSRPISRYSNSNATSRFYNNTNTSYYPYSNNRSSYPSSPTSTTSSSLLNMSRRVININNNNNNSSYVSSRPQQLAVRPSSSTSFRLPSSIRPDRY
ncbi:unnamed protein product [Mucor hiemalis]